MEINTLPRHARTGLTAVGWRKARPGETGPQPIWPILGAAEDDDDDQDPDDDTEDDDTSRQEGDDTEDDDAGKGDETLGTAGVQALEREKARRKAQSDRRRTAEARVTELEAQLAGKGEPTPEQIRAEADKAATTRANARIVRSEIRAAAAGKLNDPKDAITFLDLSRFEVDEDGEVDEDEIADAITELLKDKPYLTAAATAPRFQGGGDGGARKGSGGPVQFTEAQVKKMTPEEIDEARRKGQLRDYLGG